MIIINPTLQKNDHFLNILKKAYPNEKIQINSLENLKTVDTYIVMYTQSYGEEERSSITEGIREAVNLIENGKLKDAATIWLIFFRDIKVDFPERKLQREKIMSEEDSEELLKKMAKNYQDRIHILHEFGKKDMIENLKNLSGKLIYFNKL